MYSQNDRVALVQSAGIVTVCSRVSVRGSPEPPTQASQDPDCAGIPSAASIATSLPRHGLMTPASKPGFLSSWLGLHTALGLIVQVNEAEPNTPLVSCAVTATCLDSGVVGVPLIRPVLELIDSPFGRPVAL